MSKEFKKLDYPFLTKEDFDKNGGELGFLVRAFGNVSRDDFMGMKGVTIHSQIGDIFTAVATYEGLKELDECYHVTSIEYSRPGGSL